MNIKRGVMDRFRDVGDMKNSINLGLDIEFNLYGVSYYIGSPTGVLILSWNDGLDEVGFKDVEELLNYRIGNKSIREVVKDIEIRSM